VKKISNILGLVLSGGRSTRMGLDKSMIDYHGQPQLEHMVALLSKVCAEVYVSVRKDQKIRDGMRPLPDAFETPGPMNGILTALSKFPDRAWLIVAVDMPNIDASAIQMLVSKRDESKLATCYFNANENLPEPLLTLWEPAARSPLEVFVASGKISPREFLASNDVNVVHPKNISILLNINSPDEYDKFTKPSE
jgi:molybdenum cofactor guanylyltransferase